MSCFLCGRGIVGECDCPPIEEEQSVFAESKRGRPQKPDDEITVSAGRKRAAELYPIDPEAPCEWRGLANAGGGKHPITGCLQGKQQHIHHGPVKATYRNERTNIHLICTPCHNRYHSVTDHDYDEAAAELLPHKPRAATPKELAENDINWASGKYSKTLLAESS